MKKYGIIQLGKIFFWICFIGLDGRKVVGGGKRWARQDVRKNLKRVYVYVLIMSVFSLGALHYILPQLPRRKVWSCRPNLLFHRQGLEELSERHVWCESMFTHAHTHSHIRFKTSKFSDLQLHILKEPNVKDMFRNCSSEIFSQEPKPRSLVTHTGTFIWEV